jgi:hypothetical protein
MCERVGDGPLIRLMDGWMDGRLIDGAPVPEWLPTTRPPHDPPYRPPARESHK